MALRPGALLASGRDADIYEFGRGRVLRRSRNGRSMDAEARTMAHVRGQGYPVPEVFEVTDDGLDLVMERIEGTTMVEAAASRPWRIPSLGRTLAELHDSLHRLAAPPWLDPAPMGTGDRILHMDLHPLNVLIGPDGPIVIDWTIARKGDPSVDVAVTWALVVSGEVPAGPFRSAVLAAGRRLLLGSFLRRFDRSQVRAVLPGVVAWKAVDPNLSVAEVARMWALL